MAEPLSYSGNPFENFVTVDVRDRVKFAIMTILVVPFRVTLALMVLVVAYVVTAITLLNVDRSVHNPFSGWRRRTKDIVSQLILFVHFAIGFSRIKVKGHIASPSEAPIFVLAPHSSFFDAFPFCYIGTPSVISKKSVVDAPLIGSLLRLTVPIEVDRDNKTSRTSAMRQLCNRAYEVIAGAQSGVHWPQVAVFPEGTCTNRTQLITFKPGAFAVSLPVQPVCFKWQTKYDSISWTWDGENILTLLWLTMCQPSLNLEIEFLPVYAPNDAEKKDATLYAENVRAVMAKCLNVPVSSYSVDDAPYLTFAYKPKKVNFFKLAHQLGVTVCTGLDDVDELKLKWRCMRNNEDLRKCNFSVSVETFLDYVRVSQDARRDAVQRLFNIFDWQCRGLIDLREFLIASCCSSSEPSVTFIDFCINIFTDGGRRQISEVDFVKTVRLPFELSVKEARNQYTVFMADVSRPADGFFQSVLDDHISEDAQSALDKPMLISFGQRRRCIKAY